MPFSADFPWKRIALWGFALNAGWEFVQCTVLYDMWSWGFWRATAYMWGAILGDVLIVLGVDLGIAARLVGERPACSAGQLGHGTLLALGFAACGLLGVGGAGARPLGLLGPHADGGRCFGHTVGLSPVVQVTTLPALSVYLATLASGARTGRRRTSSSHAE